MIETTIIEIDGASIHREFTYVTFPFPLLEKIELQKVAKCDRWAIVANNAAFKSLERRSAIRIMGEI